MRSLPITPIRQMLHFATSRNRMAQPTRAISSAGAPLA